MTGPPAARREPVARQPPRDALVLRPVTRADVPALVALEREIFGTPWDAASFEAFLEPGPTFSCLAVIEERVAGYALGWCSHGDSELMNLAVAPGWRRRSIGQRLVRWALQHAARRGARVMSLEVRASNLAAQALYERHGFVTTTRRRGYYRAPREDALVMRASLVRGAAGADLTRRPDAV